MTPQTLILDRTFRGVGRIKRATGTTVPAMRRKLSAMLTALHESGRLDILRAIRDGQLTMLQVYDAYQRRTLDSLPLAGALQPLAATMEKWIAGADVSAKHAISLTSSLKYFKAAQSDAKVSDLPAILERLRTTLGQKHPRSFNLARTAAQAFVRSTLKRSHPIYAAITDVETRKATPRRKKHPLTPTEMRNFFPMPFSDLVDAIAWGQATTGMHESEYWGEWAVYSDRVHVGGTKRKGRVRDVPLVMHPAVPKIHPRTFSDKLRERTDRAITPYDLRRTYANWLESAGIPRARRIIYRGHGTKDIGDLYEWHEVSAYLKEDAEKLRVFLNVHTKAHTLTVEQGGIA